MSLTTFVKIESVRKEMLEHITMPIVHDLQMQFPRRSPGSKGALIGTALDYAIRFWLNKKYKKAEVKTIVATIAVETTRPFNSYDHRKRFKDAVSTALSTIAKSKAITDEYVHACFVLANADKAYRSGKAPIFSEPSIGRVEIDDIKRMMRHIVEIWPPVKSYCLLNPTFGWGSDIVGGADADIVQDDMLIDFKCVVRPDIEETILQLIGYVVLDEIDGVEGLPKLRSLKKVGIYFARHGELLVWPIKEIISRKAIKHLAEYFQSVSNYRNLLIESMFDEPDPYM